MAICQLLKGPVRQGPSAPYLPNCEPSGGDFVCLVAGDGANRPEPSAPEAGSWHWMRVSLKAPPNNGPGICAENSAAVGDRKVDISDGTNCLIYSILRGGAEEVTPLISTQLLGTPLYFLKLIEESQWAETVMFPEGMGHSARRHPQDVKGAWFADASHAGSIIWTKDTSTPLPGRRPGGPTLRHLSSSVCVIGTEPAKGTW